MKYFKDNADGWYQLHDFVEPSAYMIPVTKLEYDTANANNKTQSELFKEIENAIENHMDAVAQADGWDNRWTCVARAGYPNPWQQKGIKFGQWMDQCWMLTIQAQSDVVSGLRSIPTPLQAIAELPVMVW